MYRERLTITLDSEVLAAVDGHIDKEQLRNRSQTIEFLLKEGLGLHRLTQAFFFVGESWPPEQFDRLLALCAGGGITRIYLCLPTALSHRAAVLQAAAGQAIGGETTTLTSDFGDGGAVMLRQAELEHPFLLAWLHTASAFPDSITLPYLFHRQHGAAITQLIVRNQEGAFHDSGLAVASPEIVQHIPAGIADLRRNVFPQLVKQGKVRGYIF